MFKFYDKNASLLGENQILLKTESTIFGHFFQPAILHCFCLYFNFLLMPSLIEYDKPLFFFVVDSVAAAARREHNWSFPKNIGISPIETSCARGVPPA